MKIIVAYASVGSGHRSAALALYQCLRGNYPETKVDFIDILEYTNSLFSNFYSGGYSILVAHFKLFWAIGYYLTSIKFVSLLFNFISRLNCHQFINLLKNKQPDIVLTTHFFPAGVVAYLKRRGKIDSRLVTVMTDFSLHSFWALDNCDDYIVGSDTTRNLLINRGIKQDKIKVLGVPINSGFLIRHQEAKKADDFTPPFLHSSVGLPRPCVQGLGLREERAGFTALLVTGTFGFSLIEKIVDMLHSEINLLVVCGNNQRLYNRLKRKRYTGVRLFGFTDQMSILMSQADIIITKPGGLTIAEALAMRLPLIFIGSIPGQETKNAKIIESSGCAINNKGLESLKDIIIDLKTNQEKLEIMRVNIDKFKKPRATEDICRYILGDVP
jgi:processive 1,2-diacylglycerol beta-glucosyltransferase